MMKWFGWVLVLCMLCGVVRAQTTNPVTNGNFEAEKNGWAEGWSKPGNASWEEESGNHFLRLKADPKKFEFAKRTVELQPDWQALELKFKVRYEGMKKGKQQWHDARVILEFKDENGRKVNPQPGAPYFNKGSSDGWLDKTVEFLVPEGAKSLDIQPAMMSPAAGTMDVDDFVLRAIPAEPLKEKQEAARREREEDMKRRIAAVKPAVTRPSDEKMPAELKVVGRDLVDAKGNKVWLQGLSIPSMEWAEGGENILRSVDIAIKEWKSNVVRLPVNPKFWAGKGAYQKDGGAAYRQLVEDVANLCATHNAYMVLDLHRYRAPVQEDADFWKDAATRFKNHPAILFELLNEAHSISWEIWQKGGMTGDQKDINPDVPSENQEKLQKENSIGMQKLIDVIRETGAKNIVVAGGLDWGYDLSGIAKGFGLSDPNGNGIMYSSHVYPWKKDWQTKFLQFADKYPLFLGECGAEEKPMPFENPKNFKDPHEWSQDFLAAVQKYKLNWTGWCFHPKATPRVILNWEYEPTPFWGAYVKKALAGEKIEGKRER